MALVQGSDSLAAHAQELIASVRGQALRREDLAAKATELAALLLDLANTLQTISEQDRAARLARLLADPAGMALSQALTDRAHRPRSPQKVVELAQRLLSVYGIPASLPLWDRLALRLLGALGGAAPTLAASGIARRIRRETAPYLIPAQPKAFRRHLAEQHKLGLRINLNRLGEEVLSESDATHHVNAYLGLLSQPDVTTISVKISAICSRINVLAWSQTQALLQDRLRTIYRAAIDRDGPSKLVYLDMESYRDLALNLELFRTLLDEPEFLSLSAGVVLQAYIPESIALQRELTAWAEQRVKRGGAPIRLRIAKGANLALESVESSLRGWPRPTHYSKHQVDASYKRLVEFGCEPENARAVQLGIASHNLFDIAYGALQRAMHQTEKFVGFELLQGMADPLCRGLHKVVGDVLVYAPFVSDQEFNSAVAYLVRRLDENSAPENFLRHSFGLSPQSPEFERERQKFLVACFAADSTLEQPKRTQDRRDPPRPPHDLAAPFQNEPDTDFSRACNRDWIATALQRQLTQPLELSLQVDGEPFHGARASGFDPSRPFHVPYHYTLATRDDLSRIIRSAEQGLAAWSQRPALERARALLSVATGLRHKRGELIACMVLDAAKRVDEADIEVSEAIDFAEYYARSLLDLERHLAFQPRGVTLVTPPWNFPLAIPLGGVLAALAAGNSVILKPAPETVLVAERAAQILWQAGIPRQAFHLVAAEDEVASNLITDPRVATVILTGATSTARLFRKLRPNLHLCAETGGKNSIIVTSLADRELAIRDVLTSAFGHAGQKCSAASLLILEAEVHDDAHFLQRLRDAAADLVVGSAWEMASFVTPLIRAPEGPLKQALTELDAGESWLLEPKASEANPLLYTPGVKLGVQKGSFSHTTEFFGPVLGVMRAKNLEHALSLANGTSYGLTAGLHSLDETEQQYFLEHMNAGNLYVNRTITGAIVGRQPFGGRKASSVGPGLKAGGPNYLLQFMRAPVGGYLPLPDMKLPASIQQLVQRLGEGLGVADREQLQRAARSYAHDYARLFCEPQDAFHLLGQDNLLVYQPCPVVLRVDVRTSPLDLACALLASRIASAPVHISAASEVAQRFAISQHKDLIAAPSEPNELSQYLQNHGIGRIRVLGQTPEQLLGLLWPTLVHIANDPVSHCGRIELLHYLREQSRSITTHRYGHLARVSPAAP